MHCIVVSEELLADTGAGAAHRHVVDGVEGFVAFEGGLALLGTKKGHVLFSSDGAMFFWQNDNPPNDSSP